MTDDDLKSFLKNEETQSVAYTWGQLSDERAKAMDYYNQEPFGNETEGRSAVVSSDVSDSVEWILPSLIRIFAASDKAVEFEPQGMEDEESAQQATDTCNYVFWRQNPGFLTMYSWFKDALIQKNGAVKWWWDKKITKKREKYHGLTEDQLTQLLQDDDIKVVAQEQRPDDVAIQQYQEQMQQFQAMLPQYEQAVMMAQAQGQQPPPPPQPPQEPPPVYDVEVELTEEQGKVCIAPIPPEELIVSRRHNSILLEDCPFVEHITKKTLSDLRASGYEFEDEEVTGSNSVWADWAPEKLARDKTNEDGAYEPLDENPSDPSQREVWVRETYALVDYDDDGIAERRRIIWAGDKILENELCNEVQIAAITPIIITHRFYGKSIAELVMDLQLLSSTLWRQMLDNLYHANNQGHIVLSSPDGRVQANIDDLLNSRPGRVIREYAQGAVRPEQTQWVGAQTFPMLEYIDQQRMNRTGSNNLSSGVNADSLNKTARGATIASNQMQEKLELIARIFAETGVKQMFKGILYLLSKYSMKPIAFRLRNKFVSYDPRSWSNQMDMTINVGLGTGNKDQQLMHLSQIAMAQQQAVASGAMGLLVTPKNIYNVQAKIVENAGFKNVEEFWTDPGDKMPEAKPPQPDPIAIKEVQIKEQDSQTKRIQVMGDLELKKAMLPLEAAKVQMEGKKIEVSAMGEVAEIERARREIDLKGQEAELKNRMFDAKQQGDMAGMLQKVAGEQGPTDTQQLVQAVVMGQESTAQAINQMAQAIGALAQAQMQPKRRVPTRGKDGKIAHVDEVPLG